MCLSLSGKFVKWHSGNPEVTLSQESDPPPVVRVGCRGRQAHLAGDHVGSCLAAASTLVGPLMLSFAGEAWV